MAVSVRGNCSAITNMIWTRSHSPYPPNCGIPIPGIPFAGPLAIWFISWFIIFTQFTIHNWEIRNTEQANRKHVNAPDTISAAFCCIAWGPPRTSSMTCMRWSLTGLTGYSLTAASLLTLLKPSAITTPTPIQIKAGTPDFAGGWYAGGGSGYWGTAP